MFGFGNDKKKDNPWDFWNSGSDDDEGWSFGGNREKDQIDDLYGLSKREDKSFWEIISDFFFR